MKAAPYWNHDLLNMSGNVRQAALRNACTGILAINSGDRS
jgi:hypothetical protein